MPNSREWSGLAGHYGSVGESVAWRVVFDYYYWDKLSESYEAVLSMGAGNLGSGLVGFRTIEGEHMTRAEGKTERINDWLQIEAIESEVGATCADIGRLAEETCRALARRFCYEESTPTLVSVLSADANVPWMPGRHGYCVDKYPYEKICVPHSALLDPKVFESVVTHEFAHVINLNLSKGRCPIWLDEAVAMVAEGGADKGVWRRFAQGQEPWLDTARLARAFLGNREDPVEHRKVWMAYQQSAVIGYYLRSLKGEGGLADLMTAFSNNSFLKEVIAKFTEGGQTDEALGEVYGTNAENLLRDALAWLQGL